MWGVGFTGSGCFVDENFGAKGAEGSVIEVEGTVELCLGRESGIDAGGTEEIEGEKDLGQETAPEMEWEVRIGAAENGDEMALEGLDDRFSGVAVVDMGWRKLEVNIMVSEEFAEVGGGFVVKLLEARLEATGDKYIIHNLVGGADSLPGSVLHGFSDDGVAVMVVDDEEVVVVATGGRDKELAREVTVDLTGDRLAGGIDVVFTKGRRSGSRRRERRGRGVGNGREFRLGGPEVLALLGEVTHVGDERFGQVI